MRRTKLLHAFRRIPALGSATFWWEKRFRMLRTFRHGKVVGIQIGWLSCLIYIRALNEY